MPEPKYPQLTFRSNQFEFKKFQELKDKGVSVREVFEAFCDKCHGMKIVVYDKDNGEPIEIPNNILSKRK